MSIFGVGMAILGGVYALAVTAISASMDGKQQGKRSQKSQKDTDSENDTTDS